MEFEKRRYHWLCQALESQFHEYSKRNIFCFHVNNFARSRFRSGYMQLREKERICENIECVFRTISDFIMLCRTFS